MKLFIVLLSFIVLANALTYKPTAERLRRDVSELVPPPQNEYLAPPAEADTPLEETLTDVPSEDAEVQDTAVLGENGYEYKTVRRLRFRKRRDVSHLKLQHHYLPPTNEYLPPVHSKQSEVPAEHSQPSNEYLPPVSVKQSEISTEQPKPTKEYLPPVNVKESEISTEEPKPTNEYLPPVNVKEAEISTEIPKPSNDYLPPAKLEEIPVTESEPSIKSLETIEQEIEAPKLTTPAIEEDSVTVVPEVETEAPQNSAILLDDGYHYRTPLDIPNLFPQTPSSAEEILPPLDGDSVEVDGPEDGESAVLAEDGYHYRAIKRRF